MGGFGAAVLEALADLDLQVPVLRLAVPDCFVHARRDEQAPLGRRAHPGGRARRGSRQARATCRSPARPVRSRKGRRVTRRRIDVVLVERGFFASREQARAAMLAGDVRVGGEVVTKAGQPSTRTPRSKSPRSSGSSRAAERSSPARSRPSASTWPGMRAIDVGASTGGFTDCLLQRGAARVVAVDVGYGQLAWSLRTDERVTVFERTQHPRMPTPPSWARRSTSSSSTCRSSRCAWCCRICSRSWVPRRNSLRLVKPQFEAGKGRVGKRGVVKDPGCTRTCCALPSRPPRTVASSCAG